MKAKTCVFFASALFMLWYSNAEAFRASFSVAPLHLNFNADIGNTITRSITIRNTGKNPVSVVLYKKDFRVELDGSTSELTPGSLPRGCAEWIIISPVNIELAPKESRKARISLTVPRDSHGSYWAKIYVEEASKPKPIKSKEGEYGVQVHVKQRWGIAIFEDVPGRREKKGQVTDISVTPQTKESPLKVAVEFENIGNTLLRCTGRVEIKAAEGNEVETIQIGSNGRFSVYPDGKRLVGGTVSKRLLPGDYIALAIVDYGGEELVAGELEFEVK